MKKIKSLNIITKKWEIKKEYWKKKNSNDIIKKWAVNATTAI